jgi:CheY-like chemotaxis protein
MSPIRRVLVVDDNHDSADSLAMILKRMGYSVEAAYGGTAAVTAFETFAPEAVLLDIGMPDLDGYETARRIREMPSGRGAVLIAQTGWGQEEDQRRAQEVGFDAHLTKPVEIAELVRLLEKLQPAL